MDGPLWQRWYFWRRVINISIGILGLVPQFFMLTDPWIRGVGFGIAALNLILGALPDSAVTKMTRGLAGK